jgi:uncharacterized protein DUF3485
LAEKAKTGSSNDIKTKTGMNKQKCIILALALAMMGGAAGLLTRIRANQKLGMPGIKTTPIPGSIRLEIYLPERVLDYKSEAITPGSWLTQFLPADTSVALRHYTDQDGFQTLVTAVLMGADRTSIHKPQICLKGQGWEIADYLSEEIKVPMQRPRAYDLPVTKLIATKTGMDNGRPITARGVYVYWFVADHELTASHWTRVLHMAGELLKTGTLQRWAYVSCFSVCKPGDEEATFERIKKFIAASAPEFQLAPGANTSNGQNSLTAAAR